MLYTFKARPSFGAGSTISPINTLKALKAQPQPKTQPSVEVEEPSSFLRQRL